MDPSQRPDIPLAPAALGLLLGLTTALCALLAPFAPLLPAPLLLLGVLRRAPRPLILGFLLGLLLGRANEADADGPRPLSLLALPGLLELEGLVRQADLPARGAQSFRLEEIQLVQPDSAGPLLGRLKLTLRLRGRTRTGWRTLSGGERIRCLVRLRRRYGRLSGFVHDRRALTILAQAPPGRRRMAAWRSEGAARLATRLEGRDTGLARALLLGDRGQLERRDRDLFRSAGQAHMLAVSGLHVGLLVAGLILLLRTVGLSQRAVFGAGLLAVALYVPFAGAPTSAVRAGLGASAYFLARLSGRQPGGTGVLVLVAICVLLPEPTALSGASFQLSFGAVASILLLSPAIRRLLVAPHPSLPGLLPPKRAPLRSALAVSLAAWLGTAPFVATHIGRICPAGCLFSLPALPVLAVLLASGFALLFLSPLPPIAALAAFTFHGAGSLLRWLLGLAEPLHLGTLPVGQPTPLWWAAYGAGFLLAIRGPRSRTPRSRTVHGLFIMGVLLVLLFLPDAPGHSMLVSAQPAAPSANTSPLAGYHARLTPMTDLLATASALEIQALVWTGLALAAFAVLSVRPLCWLKRGGAAGAWVLGMAASWQFGCAGLAAVLAPFFVATVLGKLPGSERAGARSVRQVLCNGLPALLGCAICAAGRPEIGGPFFLGGLACLGADSCATEIGVRFGGKPWRLVGSGPIESGESGGVTVAGLVASLLGAALAPVTFALWLKMPLEGAALLTAAGFAGALIDSLLGGSLQYRGRDALTRQVVEQRLLEGQPTERVSGLRWLDNDAVNLVSGLAAGLLAVSLAGIFG